MYRDSPLFFILHYDEVSTIYHHLKECLSAEMDVYISEFQNFSQSFEAFKQIQFLKSIVLLFENKLKEFEDNV